MTRSPLTLLSALLGLLTLVGIAASLAWAVPEQGVAPASYGGVAQGSPWYVTALIVCAPGAIAVLLTIASGIMVKRVNRAAKQSPLSVPASIKWTLAFGALWGPMVSWGFGELVYSLTNVMTSWKLIAISPFITGLASMIAYDMLRWYTQKRHPGLYALLSVKHPKPGIEDDNDGDLTRMAATEDRTEPRE